MVRLRIQALMRRLIERMTHLVIHGVRIQSVVKEVTFCLSHRLLFASMHHGNSARGGVCLHADVWWQRCYYVTKKRITTLKGSRVALL